MPTRSGFGQTPSLSQLGLYRQRWRWSMNRGTALPPPSLRQSTCSVPPLLPPPRPVQADEGLRLLSVHREKDWAFFFLNMPSNYCWKINHKQFLTPSKTYDLERGQEALGQTRERDNRRRKQAWLWTSGQKHKPKTE